MHGIAARGQVLKPAPLFGLLAQQDAVTVARCKKKGFELHRQGLLQVLIDDSHSFRGLEQIPDAVEHMLRGAHTGKVVIEL